MAEDYSNADRFLSNMKDSRDADRRGDDRHRSSRYDDRDFDRFPRRDDRDRRDRAERPRDRDSGPGRYDDRRGPRHDDDRRRDFRGERGGRREESAEMPPRRRDDDRGFGGGGRGRERARGRDRDDPERRSPTPEGCLPLSKRKRKASGWDVPAPGYEQYTAMQAKQTGLFNLPGANRTQVAPILSMAGLPTPVPVPTFGMGIGGNPNLARQSRRLYIGSITPDINEQNLADFFNSKMKEMDIGTGVSGDPVLAVQVNYEKNYAFVEFRSAEDATAAMAFDGIMFLSVPLKIRRPKDYAGNDLVVPSSHVPGVVSTNVPDSINKVFVGGLPTYLNEEQVMELLKSFGELKAFNLVRDNGTGPSKGFAFFEYVDVSVTDVAIQGLNGMELADRYLVVQRASIGAKSGTGMIPNPDLPADALPAVPKPIMPAGDLTTQPPSDARILLMLNMVTPEDLINDQEYEDLVLDIRDECENYGRVVDLRIPRPVKKDKSKWAPGDGGGMAAAADAIRADEAAGVGRVYVKYEEANSAANALNTLAGRSFAGRSIIATLLSENSQTTPPLNLIFSQQPPPPPPE